MPASFDDDVRLGISDGVEKMAVASVEDSAIEVTGGVAWNAAEFAVQSRFFFRHR